MKRKFHKANEPSDPHAALAEAATWVMRLDRGLSPEEQDRYLQWLAANPHHGQAMARQRRTWDAFDRLAGLQCAVEAVPDPDLLVPCRERGWRRAMWVALPLVAAACLAVMFWPRSENTATPATIVASGIADVVRLAPIEERALPDGSMLRLNRGAEVALEYSAAERRVRLVRGEAAFDVAKDATRPFVVLAGGIVVRAVGTAFNVRLEERAVDVIVTAGRVAVSAGEVRQDETVPTVEAGQRVIVPHDSAAGSPVVSTPVPEELSRRLAWQPRLLTFTDEPLPVILAEFNRHNPVALRLDHPALQELRLSARFRSDNVSSFLRLLESEFGVRAQQETGGDIVLRGAW